MTERRLQFNPDPIKLVPAAQRDVWTKQPGARCHHEDGRGRCTSRETRSFWVVRGGYAVAFCERHWHEVDELR